jgi:hypothetical protein
MYKFTLTPTQLVLDFMRLNCAAELYDLFAEEPGVSTVNGILRAMATYNLLKFSHDPSDNTVCILCFDNSVYGGLTALLAHLTEWTILYYPTKTKRNKFFEPSSGVVPVDNAYALQPSELTLGNIPEKFAVCGNFNLKHVVNKVLRFCTGEVILISDLYHFSTPNVPMYRNMTTYAGLNLTKYVVDLSLRGKYYAPT